VALQELLAALDAERREAFVLTLLVGLSYAEAADVAGCPVGTIRSRVARARDDLVASFGGTARRRDGTG
jgi:RNA polymerase sigma-70 factor (ECF subfamily)